MTPRSREPTASGRLPSAPAKWVLSGKLRHRSSSEGAQRMSCLVRTIPRAALAVVFGCTAWGCGGQSDLSDLQGDGDGGGIREVPGNPDQSKEFDDGGPGGDEPDAGGPDDPGDFPSGDPGGFPGGDQGGANPGGFLGGGQQ